MTQEEWDVIVEKRCSDAGVSPVPKNIPIGYYAELERYIAEALKKPPPPSLDM